MLSLSSIELLLGVGLVSILPLVFVVLRATMGRVARQSDERYGRSSRHAAHDPRQGAGAPLQPHIAGPRAKTRQTVVRRDRIA
jgi:hypothetical protein